MQHNGLQAVVLRAREGDRTGDHPKRYRPGQRLAVKPYIPGPTECHVILTSVRGKGSKPAPFYLGDVDYAIARELGYVRLDAFHEAWVREHDTAWVEKALPNLAGGVCEQEAILERFRQQWASKLGWLLHFELEPAQAPARLLAAGGGCSWQEIRDAQEARERFRAPKDTDADRGYTTSDSQSLRDAGIALTDDEWKLHIGPQSRYREQDRLAERRAAREAQAHPQRLQAAKTAAKAKGYDVRDEVRRYERLVEQGNTEKALRQLERIEARCFPVAA